MNKTFKEFKQDILDNYGVGTDAPYEILIQVKGGKQTIDQYVELLNDEDYADYLLDVENLPDYAIDKIAILKANIAHLITSDARGETIYNKLSCFDDFCYIMTSLLYTCFTINPEFSFEWLISYIMHLDIDTYSVKEAIEEIGDDLEAEYFTDSIELVILEDLNDKLTAFSEYCKTNKNNF